VKATPILIDTNLLVLYVVGTASRSYIGKHKRLTEFVVDDYDALLKLINNASAVFVTPHTLAETSNLARHIGEPARTEVLTVLQALISDTDELAISSKSASARKEFLRLGLTDAVLLEATDVETILLTTDLDLYLAVQANGIPAINFNHIRDQYM
jgi:hypothetical protein